MGTEVSIKEQDRIAAALRHDHELDRYLRMSENLVKWGEYDQVLLEQPLPDKFRTSLTLRATVLELALRDDSPNIKAAHVADMLGSYDPRRRAMGPDGNPTPEAEGELRKWLADLAGIPTWAVAEACAKIKTGTAKIRIGYRFDGDVYETISDVYRPTTIQVQKLCRQIMEKVTTEKLRIERVLNAKLDPNSVTDEERAVVGPKIKTFAVEFARGDHRGEPSPLEAMAAQRRQDTLAELAAGEERMKLREYEALGIEPIRWGDGQVMSVALLRTLGRLPPGKAKAKKAKTKAA